jgi:heptosyltransferase-2
VSEPAVVLRRSSLGDVVLAGGITGALGPVIFHTRAAWAEVAARLPGVVEVRPWSLAALPERARLVVDLQASLESARMARRVRGPRRRVDPARLRRHLRVAFKTAPPPTLLSRYAAAAGVVAQPHPWIGIPRTPGPTLLLAPGAAWATKRWPEDRWADLARRWGGPVVLLGGADDRERCETVQRLSGRDLELACEQGFGQTFRALERGAVLVAGDTGLLHLGAACGVPVAGIFGPTHSTDGHWCHPGATVERDDLPCRPCSRFGGTTCPAGDHACLAGLPVERVWQALTAVAGGAP